MKKRKYVIVLLISIVSLLFIAYVVDTVHHFIMKKSIMDEIEKNKSNLDLLLSEIEEIEESTCILYDSIEVENNEYLRELFINCNLDEIRIHISSEEYLQVDGTFIYFLKKTKQKFGTGTRYGFYYTELNETIGFGGIDAFKEGENITWFGVHYKYHAEQIKDNWWYYEIKFY